MHFENEQKRQICKSGTSHIFAEITSEHIFITVLSENHNESDGKKFQERVVVWKKKRYIFVLIEKAIIRWEWTENNNKKTLSVKTLKSSSGKICPQTIGQPTYKKWDEYFNQDQSNSDKDRFMYIKNNIDNVM